MLSALVVVLTMAPGAESRSNRATAWCDPTALTPVVYSDNTGRSHGTVDCFEGSYTFKWAQRLYNNSGGVLWDSGALREETYYHFEVWGVVVGCSGAVVKSWMYTTDYFGGDQASDTSGTNSDCAY